jgi:3,4-dihydroxyphenylacetate 2,3-dioxygenase
MPMTALPALNLDPPFDITRASHVVLTVRDLGASRRFYEEVIGLVLTLEEDDTLYFRGVEEACHHSLVLRKSRTGERACQRIGMRMFTERDLENAHGYFKSAGCEAAWADVPHQGKTLHATDPFGIALEFCARMPVMPRQITKFTSHKGGCAQRIDHYQLLTPDARKACAFYMGLGFMLTEYIAPDDGHIRGVFLQRKGNPHDIVFFSGAGPRLHHVAFLAPEVHNLLRACDVAGQLGFGRGVERGPGRHGPGHALFVYFRDPDGHRVELFNTHYQVMDIETEPVRWDPNDADVSFPWGLPAQSSWFEQATPFENRAIVEPPVKGSPLTLEKFLAQKV